MWPKKKQLRIHDDLEFIVELYDPNKLEGEDRLPGDDTQCRVTILDEDFPGTIGFASTEINVHKTAKEVEIEIESWIKYCYKFEEKYYFLS